jgi:hypothetical protein
MTGGCAPSGLRTGYCLLAPPAQVVGKKEKMQERA